MTIEEKAEREANYKKFRLSEWTTEVSSVSLKTLKIIPIDRKNKKATEMC